MRVATNRVFSDREISRDKQEPAPPEKNAAMSRSTAARCVPRATLSSYVRVQRGRQNVGRLARERNDFAVDHRIDRRRNIEIDVTHRTPRSERMLNVCPVIKLREHAYQTKPPDRPPAHELDVTVARIGIRRDHHRAARELAVVKREKQTAALIPIFVVIATRCKRPPIQLRHANKDAKQIAKMSERLESPIRKRPDVCGESDAEQIQRIRHAVAVRE